MKEWVYTCLLRPEAVEAYDAYHADAWPDVVASLRETGVHAIRIYRLQTRLVMIMQTGDDYDPAAAAAVHWNRTAHTREWEELMQSYQQRPPEAPPGEGTWTLMKQVFDM